MSKVIEKNAILSDIIQKSIDIIQLYGLMNGRLVIDVSAKKESGCVTLSYTQKENNETITVSRQITKIQGI